MIGPRVTIVVPAYNSAETIAETISCLGMQTYKNMEVIVVNDGSSDATSEIANKSIAPFAKRMRLLSQVNQGQAAALNNGWAQASGDFIGYLSADDIVYPEAIARLVEYLLSHPQIVGVYPDYDLIDANSKPIRRIFSPNFSSHDLVEKSICQPGPGALFRKSAYEKTGGWNKELKLTPDFDFWVRLTKHGDLERLPESLAGFRVHEGSQSFAVPSETKSEEPPKVISGFFQGGTDSKYNQNRAMSWAHVLSMRLHLRGGRWLRALSHLASALARDCTVIFYLRFWHLFMSGTMGRLRYRLSSATSKSSQ